MAEYRCLPEVRAKCPECDGPECTYSPGSKCEEDNLSYLPPDIRQELKAYRATGLEPDEIQEVVDLLEETIFPCDLPAELKRWAERCTWHVKKCAELNRELRRYKEAEQAGRLVVLPSEDYTWHIRSDIALDLIIANCRRAKEEAEHG